MQSSFMEFDFGRVHYRYAFSDKKKTILFLHSFHSSAEAFSKVCSLLQDYFNLLCLDFPGHGLSEHVDVCKYPQCYSLDGLTEILIEFVSRLKIDNIFVVGNSLGGNTIVRALPSLKAIKGLVLIGSAQARSKKILFNIHFPTAPLNLLFQKTLNDQEIGELTRAYVYQSKEGEEGANQMAYDIKNTDSNIREYFSHYLETQAWVDEIQILKSSALPLLYILGVEDGFIDSLRYRELLIAEGIPESQIKLINQCGHSVHLNNPNLCAKLILEFVNGIPID